MGDDLALAFNEGAFAARQGKSENDNPYTPSGHERDTTFDDELHFQWYSGFHSVPSVSPW